MVSDIVWRCYLLKWRSCDSHPEAKKGFWLDTTFYAHIFPLILGLDLPKHWLQTPSFKASQDLSSLVSVDALHKAFSINQVHKEATWVTNSPVLNKSRHLRSTCLLFLSSIWKTPCLGNKFVHSHKHFEKSFRCVLTFAWYSMYEAVHYSIHTWMCALSCLDGSPE